MITSQKLIVGLGNPTEQYRFTRHNVGFLFVDVLAEFLKLPPFVPKFQGAFTQYAVADTKIFLLKPFTYMNLSGNAVLPAMQFFKVAPQDVIIVYDDVDTFFGKIKVRDTGGHGGHNGIRHIQQLIGNDFCRLKIGVGRPPPGEETTTHVLNRFREDEMTALGILFERMCSFFPVLLQDPNLFVSKVLKPENLSSKDSSLKE
jgi:PTH1 family peptidyl-tRNA hydrolase